MDDNPSRTSESAAATRKRRSSILKSQRPPRTPFSELEFHVTTPPDTAKSRRVSFSRRTGVAEFVTNEATTTWTRHFYEEHNKSHESSGNESGNQAPRQTVGHLGKRIFDQQFQEVMAVDLVTSHENVSSRNISNSFNNVNLTEQLVALEGVTGTNLSIPHQRFEMSALTDHQSKVFDDLALPTMGEMSGKIDINFSAVQTIGAADVKDDLDEIQADLERVRGSVVCGPFGGRDLSEYIEVDLNSTHVTVPNDASDMSITDTIRSPKVQDVSRSNSLNKSASRRDWVEDKENMGAYGCAVPVVSNAERRNTVVYENDTGNISVTQAVPCNIILAEDRTEKGKTVVYESDLADLSVTQAVPANILIVDKGREKRKTIIYDNDAGDVSVTQAVPTNMILAERNRTVITEDGFGNISITQAVPMAKIITKTTVQEDVIAPEAQDDFAQTKHTDKRKTIVFEDDAADISETQVIPPHVTSTVEIKSEHSHSVVKTKHGISFNDVEVISKRKTIVFDDGLSNISITQAIPANIILSNDFDKAHKSDASVHINEKDVFVEKEIASHDFENRNHMNVENKRKTIVFEDDMNNISVTQAIPANIIISHSQVTENNAHTSHITIKTSPNSKRTQHFKEEIDDKETVFGNRRQTVVFETEDGNMSITEAVPQERLARVMKEIVKKENNDLSLLEIRTTGPDTIRKSIVFDKTAEKADMSFTQAILGDKLIEHVQKVNTQPNVEFDDENFATDAKRRTLVFEQDNENGNMSITEAIPQDVLLKVLNKTASSRDETKLLKDISMANELSLVPDVKAQMFITESVPQIESSIAANKSNIHKTDKEAHNLDVSRKIEPLDCQHANRSVLNMTAPADNSNVDYAYEKSHTSNKELHNLDVSRKMEALECQHLNRSVFNTTAPKDNLKIDYEPEKSHTSNKEPHNLDVSRKMEPLDCQHANKSVFNMTAPADNLKVHEKSLCGDRTLPDQKRTTDVAEILNMSVTESSEHDTVEEEKRNELMNNLSPGKPVESKSMCMDFEQSVLSEKFNKSSVKCHVDRSLNKSVNQNVFVYQSVIQQDSKDHTHSVAQDHTHSEAEISVSGESEAKVDTNTDDNNEDMNVDINTSSTARLLDPLKPTPNNTDAPINEIPLNSTKPSHKSHKTILDDLLDMSSTSFDTSIDKSVEAIEEKDANKFEASSESLIHVKDSDEETQTERIEEKADRSLKSDKSLAWDYKETCEKKVTKMKTTDASIVDAIRGTDMRSGRTMHEAAEERYGKSFRDANDTNELLEMLSDLTDKSRVFKEEQHEKELEVKPEERLEKEEEIKPSSAKNVTQCPDSKEPRRFSLAPSRMSIAISREDLWNNISMAQAALQRSIEMDDSAEDSTTTPEESPPVNPNRISNEVAKKLHFDDESDTENATKTDSQLSSLKKTAFSQPEQPKEKARVIPGFLKDVPEDLKVLMGDLVKPNADSLPIWESRRSPTREPSTCSKQVQANLVTSSQIDLDSDAGSPLSCVSKFGNALRSAVVEKVDPRAASVHVHSPKSPIHMTHDRIVVFDHENPLNNILLAPPDHANVHKYSPPKEASVEKSNPDVGEDCDQSKDVTQYNVETALVCQSMKPSGDAQVIKDTRRISTKDCKTDESILKDSEVNTVIAMKTNKELIEMSSSLTLVDGAMSKGFDVESDAGTCDSSSTKAAKSPVEFIYKNQQPLSENKDSDFTSADDAESVYLESKPKKRFYSPAKRNQSNPDLPTEEVTPKPVSKMVRMSNSPKSCPDQTPPPKECDSGMDVDPVGGDGVSRSTDKLRSPKRRARNVTVQEMVTESDLVSNVELDKEKDVSDSSTSTDVNGVKPEPTNSFTSSKNQGEVCQAYSGTTIDTSSCKSRLGWTPSDGSRNSLSSESESSVNIVAKIEMLPFMGSKECEWESADLDAWRFRLLHGRLRLLLRLPLRQADGSPAGARVCADTPVEDVTLEAVHADNENQVALVCVNLAAEATRYLAGGGRCTRAGHAPALLRRCAGVARLALRWGRAMHEARLRLAYRLAPDGRLTLKVANVPLRSVWQVSLRVEMVVEDARQAPWPRAGDVRIASVCGERRVDEDAVRRAVAHLPRDWGHAPRALWKIFRYLKNMTSDHDMLGLT